ncbi:hypothetical protein Tcan_06717 [Toxocara canis]|uniref:Uncharacterized protein n=1 Tax=Toxocara canis TaxID=6265 RepID=A0A0B2VN22_TOXCA|nr:hypothetical protein Tcan_06717 [Toxocara canis]
MALAIILFAAAGCIAAFLYFKMLICVKEYAVPLKSECTQSIVGNSPLASTAKEAQSTETAKPKGGNEAPLQPERNLTTPGDKEDETKGTMDKRTSKNKKQTRESYLYGLGAFELWEGKF